MARTWKPLKIPLSDPVPEPAPEPAPQPAFSGIIPGEPVKAVVPAKSPSEGLADRMVAFPSEVEKRAVLRKHLSCLDARDIGAVTEVLRAAQRYDIFDIQLEILRKWHQEFVQTAAEHLCRRAFAVGADYFVEEVFLIPGWRFASGFDAYAARCVEQEDLAGLAQLVHLGGVSPEFRVAFWKQHSLRIGEMSFFQRLRLLFGRSF